MICRFVLFGLMTIGLITIGSLTGPTALAQSYQCTSNGTVVKSNQPCATPAAQSPSWVYQCETPTGFVFQQQPCYAPQGVSKYSMEKSVDAKLAAQQLAGVPKATDLVLQTREAAATGGGVNQTGYRNEDFSGKANHHPGSSSSHASNRASSHPSSKRK